MSQSIATSPRPQSTPVRCAQCVHWVEKMGGFGLSVSAKEKGLKFCLGQRAEAFTMGMEDACVLTPPDHFCALAKKKE